MTSLDETSLDSAVSLIAGARRVVVVGLGSSDPVAVHLLQQLGQAGCAVRLASQPGQTGFGEPLGTTARVSVWLECPLTTASSLDSHAAAMSVVTELADRVMERVSQPPAEHHPA